jgi:7-cyano-7-deazaguanine synthase in queuosine biosynthesis
MIDSRSALVLFSGGEDSTTCLAWALDRPEQVETISSDYRQRHRIELDQRLVVLREIRRRFPEWVGRHRNERGPRNDHGCGECPACALRQRGFPQWRETLS